MLEHICRHDSICLFDPGVVQIINICIDQSYILQFISLNYLLGLIGLDIDALDQFEGLGQRRKENTASAAKVYGDPAFWNCAHHAAMNRLEAGPKELADKANRIEIQPRHSNTDPRNLPKKFRRNLLKCRRRLSVHPL